MRITDTQREDDKNGKEMWNFSGGKNGSPTFCNCCLPDSETDGLPVDLSEFLQLPEELVDAVPREHSEILRRFDNITAEAAATAAAAAAALELLGALVLSPWKS